MDTLVLAAETREQRGTGACSKMRRAGLVPAVVYGRGQDPVSISVPAKVQIRNIDFTIEFLSLFCDSAK